jgi:hypothetical protein
MMTFNGIGTQFVGKKDIQPDGYYITTQWYVFLFFPVTYKGTFRVKELPPDPNISGKQYTTQQIDKDEQLVKKIRTIYWIVLGVIIFINVNFRYLDYSLTDFNTYFKILIYWLVANFIIEWQKDNIKW